jgi:putative Ca2+/H+ antiporter (TMEM165/GDT1 family)
LIFKSFFSLNPPDLAFGHNLGVLARPIALATGWSFAWVVAGLSLGLVCAGMVSPHVGDAIQRRGGRPVLAVSATLFGGFASTCCWPLSAALVSRWGWRDACFTYAAIHLFIVLPLYLWLLPVEFREDANPSHAHARETPRAIPTEALPVFFLMAIAITVSAMISTWSPFTC